jgi:dehydrogenase/reductase SDR family member 7B
MDFNNKNVFITGASSGIGEALAYAFNAAGARVIIAARRADELQRVKNACKHPNMVDIVLLDLANSADVITKTNAVLAQSNIDILVNNGGISQRSMAKDTSMDVYRNIMEINFFGTIQLSNLVLQHFIKNNQGIFVNLSSVTGVVGLPLRTAYTASKHALEGYFKSLRTELWKTNIKILMVRPASIKTNIAKNALVGDGSTFNSADAVIDKGNSPESLADAILRAIVKNKKTLYAGPALQQIVVRLNNIFPNIMFHVFKKVKT